MHVSRFAILAASAILAAACSPSVGGTPAPTRAPSATPTTTAVSTAPATATPPTTAPSRAAAARIEVELTDTLLIEPGTMTVPAGVPVTFVITNGGFLEHEFYLGDEAAQVAHEAEMLSMGGMTHDDPEGIAVGPGQTKELTYTFEAPGETLAGCHVVGHYLAGMKATVVIEG